MHPFGGTPICPRCNKAVYAAEQMMGPGRKLYHKPCLACVNCNKRLDSFSLVEHDQEPYCKTCHVKIFGTRDLRQANLPDRDDVSMSPPTSPTRASPVLRTPTGSPAPAPFPMRRAMTGNGSFGGASNSAVSPPSFLQPTRSFNPTRGRSVDLTNRSPVLSDSPQETDELPHVSQEDKGDQAIPTSNGFSTPGRSTGGHPPTLPQRPSAVGQMNRSPTKFGSPATFGRSNGSITVPLVPTATGTRYGVALTGSPLKSGALTPMPTGGRQWGGGTPSCAKCGKSVYFAEQVKAAGKTFHKGCLRCTECNSSLDSTRLTEKEGDPYCQRCYSKVRGPQGSGYALIGKAGG